MLLKDLPIVATGCTAFAVAAPVGVFIDAREANPANIYGQAHTLKMAVDAFKREATPANICGQARVQGLLEKAKKEFLEEIATW